jgi:hypothetical protein
MSDWHGTWRRPYTARGDFMWGGMAVVVSHDLPREHIADEIVPVYWPRPIRWLWAWPRKFRPGSRVERDQAFMAAGKLFVPPAMAEAMRNAPHAH